MQQQPGGASFELHRGQAHGTTAEGALGIAVKYINCYLIELDFMFVFCFYMFFVAFPGLPLYRCFICIIHKFRLLHCFPFVVVLLT